MANMAQGGKGSKWRVAGWGAAVFLLLLPFAAMQFTNEVNWDAFDFIFAGTMFAIVGGTIELTVRRTRDFAYRTGVVVALAAAFLLVWVTGAVGIIGSEDNPANLMYFGVLGIAVLGSAVSQFRANGMAFAMVAAGAAQAAIGVIALIRELGTDGAAWPMDVIGATGFFTALWLLAAGLFRRSAAVARAK